MKFESDEKEEPHQKPKKNLYIFIFIVQQWIID